MQQRVAHAVAWLQAQSRDNWLAVGLFVVAAVLRLNRLNLPLDNYDEGVYLESLRALARGHALYGSVFCAQPPLFLLGLLPWFTVLGGTLWAARCGVAIISLLGLGAAWWAGRELGGPRIALIGLAILAFDPLLVTQSRSAQAEAPSLAFTLLAVAAALSARRTAHARVVVLCGALFATSLLIKLFTVPTIIPLAWFLLPDSFWRQLDNAWQARHMPQWSALWSAARVVAVPFALGAAGMLCIALALVAGQLGAAWHQVVGLHVSATGTFGAQRLANLGLFTGIWWEAPLVVTGTFAGILGWSRRRADALVCALWGWVCIGVLLVQTPLFDHHLCLFVPGFALATAQLPALLGWPSTAGPRLRRTLEWLARVTRLAEPQVVALGLALIVASGAFTTVRQQSNNLNHPPQALEVAALDLNSLTLPGDLVITDDQIIAVLANRDVPPELVDTSTVRIASGDLTAQRVISAASDPHVTAILWYSGRFDQLRGLHSWVSANFIRYIDYGNGHGLFLRRPILPVG